VLKISVSKLHLHVSLWSFDKKSVLQERHLFYEPDCHREQRMKLTGYGRPM